MMRKDTPRSGTSADKTGVQKTDVRRFILRTSRTESDIEAARALRAETFASGKELSGDSWDATASHFLIEDRHDGTLVCCFRVQDFRACDAEESYSAGFYDLARLQTFGGILTEVGRFCVAPGRRDPDILRLAWSAIAAHAGRQGTRLLFGCSSFRGTDPMVFGDALALLRERHIAPGSWLPGVRAPDVFRFSGLGDHAPDPVQALRSMPPLLRSYLRLGARVSDHAVIDRQMNTTHVFTGLDISVVPASRRRLLERLT